MKVYTIKGFRGHYPVGTAAIVVAENLDRATELINHELDSEGLPPIHTDELTEVDLSEESVDLLCNGDY